MSETGAFDEVSTPEVERRKEPLRRWVEEVLNARAAHVVPEIIARDYVGHFPPHAEPEPVRGVDGYLRLVGAVHRGFPDAVSRITHLVACAGDIVVIRIEMQATHLGEYRGIPPTGRRWKSSMIVICRVVDGKIAETWQEVDALGMMQYIGVAPPLGVGPLGFLGWALSTVVRIGFAGIRMRLPRRASTTP